MARYVLATTREFVSGNAYGMTRNSPIGLTAVSDQSSRSLEGGDQLDGYHYGIDTIQNVSLRVWDNPWR